MKKIALVLLPILLIALVSYWGFQKFYNEIGEILGASRFNWYESQNYEEIEGANEFAAQRLAKRFHVFVNGIFIDIGYEWDGIIHVPIRTISSSLNWQVNWIAEMGVIQLVKGPEESYVDIVNFFGKAYVDMQRLENLLRIDQILVHGGNIEISYGNTDLKDINIHGLTKLNFYINGMKMTDRALIYNNKEYIPTQTIAQSYARRFCYDAILGEAYIDDSKVKSVFVDGQAYSTLEEIQRIIDTSGDQLEFKITTINQESPSPVLYKGEPQQKVIALTFDDYLGDQVDELLNVLDKHQVKGTFFIIGNSIEGSSRVLEDLIQRGHEPANHTWDHYNCHTLTDDELRAQLIATQLMINKHGRGESRFFRPPGGYYDSRITAIAQDIGLTTVLWSLNSTDADFNNGPEEIIKTVTRWVQPGSVIVMHTNRKSTIESLPEIISSLKARGYTFATLSELLKTQEKGVVK